MILSMHAVQRFVRRANLNGVTYAEAEEAMRILMEGGVRGRRRGQPIIKSQGWVFVLRDDPRIVVTCFKPPTPEFWEDECEACGLVGERQCGCP